MGGIIRAHSQVKTLAGNFPPGVQLFGPREEMGVPGQKYPEKEPTQTRRDGVDSA